MMGLLKDLTREIQNKAWAPFGKKEAEESAAAPAPLKKAESFCDPASDKPCLTVCVAREGCECDCRAVREALESELERRGLQIAVANAKAGCSGKCKNGPFIGFPQKGYFYLNVHPENVPEIVEETIMNGRILHPHLSVNPDRSYRTDLYFERETGLLAAIDDSICMVEAAKYFLDFEEGLSCGKCVPCRIGMKRMHESITRIVEGKGTQEDLDQIKLLCETMKVTPHCDFAMASSRPVLSAMNYFADEFKAHVERQECPAGVCKDLVELQRKKAIRERLRKKK